MAFYTPGFLASVSYRGPVNSSGSLYSFRVWDNFDIGGAKSKSTACYGTQLFQSRTIFCCRPADPIRSHIGVLLGWTSAQAKIDVTMLSQRQLLQIDQMIQTSYQPSSKSGNALQAKCRVTRRTLHPGSPNLVHRMIFKYPDLVLILDPKGQRSRSHSSKISVYAYSVIALYWHSPDGDTVWGWPRATALFSSSVTYPAMGMGPLLLTYLDLVMTLFYLPTY